MAEYNHAPFNLTPFNTSDETGSTQYLIATLSERVTGVFSQAYEYYLLCVPRETINANVSGLGARFPAPTLSEQVSTSARVEGVYTISATLAESVSANTKVGANEMLGRVTQSETVTGTADAVCYAHERVTLSEAVSAQCTAGRNIYLGTNAYEEVGAVCSTESMNAFTCELAVTLGAGKTLIVDARNFNVLLDNANAIHTQSGDWLTELNRRTIGLNISSASSQNLSISATLLYTEKFL